MIERLANVIYWSSISATAVLATFWSYLFFFSDAVIKDSPGVYLALMAGSLLPAILGKAINYVLTGR